MAIVQYTISFTPTPGSYGTYIEYKRKEDSVWIAPTAYPNPTMLPYYYLDLDNSYEYDIRLSSIGVNCTTKYVYTEITFNSPTYIWVPDMTVCEQDDIFEVDQDYTGFSSPYIVYYNPNNGKCYVVDGDYTLGNAYTFDPVTFSGIGDITLISGVNTYVYNGAIDPVYNRVYYIGLNTGGLKVLDMSTDTFSTVAYGTDGTAFNRIFIYLSDDNIYVNDGGISRFYIIDRASLVVTTDQAVSSYPSGSTYLNGDFHLQQVGSDIWSVAGFRTDGTVGVYNSDLTSLIDTITIPGIMVETSSRYRQTVHYDSLYDKVYISDAGSKKLFVYDGSSRVLVETIEFTNTQGKTYGSCSVTEDPVTGEYFISYRGYNSPSDSSPNIRVYRLDRNTSSFNNMLLDQSFSNLSSQTATSFLWGAYAGIFAWDGGSGWDTDGVITKYTR